MSDKLSNYWDKIHESYTSSYDNWLDKYINLFDLNSKIVELGCGRAYSSNHLFKLGFKNILACDFSKIALDMVKKENPELKTMLFDMSKEFSFADNSIDIIIADLSLHYFDNNTTKYIFNEIHRTLKTGGYLIARVNSVNDKLHIPVNNNEIEHNFYYDGNLYKRFFDKSDFEQLFKNFDIYSLEEKHMTRYVKEKVLWEFCLRKK